MHFLSRIVCIERTYSLIKIRLRTKLCTEKWIPVQSVIKTYKSSNIAYVLQAINIVSAKNRLSNVSYKSK